MSHEFRNRISEDGEIPVTTGAFTNLFAKMIRKVTLLIRHFLEALAETRKQRALIEAGLYRGRYRITSKNDDDLPIVR